MLPVSRLIACAMLVVCGASLTFEQAAIAQDRTEIPPLPRPRPDPDNLPAIAPATAPETSTAADAIASITAAPQPVRLSVRISQDGPNLTEGVVWRVYDRMPDANGDMKLLAKSQDANARMELPPGDYVLHVAYGRAQYSEPLSVNVGANEKVIDLEAGALRLNASVTGDIPIEPTHLKFDIYTAGDATNRTLIAENVPPNEVVTLTAGTYHIVSRFGAINAQVRADLHVETGELTDATLYHRASEVSFKLVSETGGEAIADVEWTVKSPEGDTIFTERGAFPSTVLAEGIYLVLAKQGEQVYNREVEVLSGGSREIEVLTSVYPTS
jgi:hypothetical protein